MSPELTIEQVESLLGNATNPDSWYWQPGWGLQCYFPDGLGLLVPDEQKAGDMLLMEAAPQLARLLLALMRQQQAREDLWRDAQAADDVLEYAQKYMRTEGEKADWSEVMGNLKQARQCLAVPSRRQALKGESQ